MHPSNSCVIFRLMQCAPELAQFNQSNRNSVTVPITQCAPIALCGRFKGRFLFNLFGRKYGRVIYSHKVSFTRFIKSSRGINLDERRLSFANSAVVSTNTSAYI